MEVMLKKGGIQKQQFSYEVFNNHIKFYAKAEIVYFSRYFEMLSDESYQKGDCIYFGELRQLLICNLTISSIILAGYFISLKILIIS